MTWKEQYHQDLEDERWKEKRQEVLDFYHNQCMGCGATGIPLDIHHPKYLTDKNGQPLHPWQYRLYQMIPYCRECHQKIHGKEESEGDKEFTQSVDERAQIEREIVTDEFITIHAAGAGCLYNQIQRDMGELDAKDFYDYICYLMTIDDTYEKVDLSKAYKWTKEVFPDFPMRRIPRLRIKLCQHNFELFANIWDVCKKDKLNFFEMADGWGAWNEFRQEAKHAMNIPEHSGKWKRLNDIPNWQDMQKTIEEDYHDEDTMITWDYPEPKRSFIRREGVGGHYKHEILLPF